MRHEVLSGLLCATLVLGCSGRIAPAVEGGGSGPTACTAATKTPIVLHRRATEGEWGTFSSRIVAGASRLFWVDGRSIVATEKSGGATATFGSALAYELAADGPRLVYSNLEGTRGVYAMPLAGGAPEELARVENPIFALADGALYWAEYDQVTAQSTVRVRAGTGTSVVFGPNAGRIDRIAVDGDDLFVATGSPTTDEHRLLRLPKGGGSPTVLWSGRHESVTAMTVAEGSVVWGEWGGVGLWRVPVTGGAVQTLLEATDANLGAPTIRDGFVYVADRATGRILRVPLAGGAPAVLASGQPLARALTVDDTCMYWLRSDATGDGGSDAAPGDVYLTAMARP
jgi:hypothetical protein